MKIDLAKISKIKNKKSLKKYSIKKPLFLGNYLFHYLIDTDNLQGIKIIKHPVYKLNEDNLNGFHQSAKKKKYKILKYLIKKYPRYIFNLNKNNENFMHYLNPNDNKYLRLILNNNLDWNELMLQYSNDDINPLDDLFLNGKYKVIDKIIKKIDFKHKKYLVIPSYFNIMLNQDLKSESKLKIIKMLEKKIPKFYSFTNNRNGMNIFWYSLMTRDLKIIKYVAKNINLDHYNPINGYNTFRTAYASDCDYDNFKISNFIWDNIKCCHNFKTVNKNGDNLAHFIINKRLENNHGNYKLEKKILLKCNEWNSQNIYKETPLHLLVNLDFKKYSKILKGKNIDVYIRNEFDEICLDYCGKLWKKYLLKFPRIKKESYRNIKLLNNKYSHGNLFQAKFSDCAIYAKILSNKYSNLYLPKYINNTSLDLSCDMCLNVPDNFLHNYLNFPWLVIWNRKKNYWIHPYLNQLINSIRKNKSHDFSCLFLSIRMPNGGLHASMIMYDFKRMTVFRFDPYGDTMLIDDDIDDFFEEELTWNTGFNYLRPNEYLPVSGFQTISDENNLYNQKLGDFGGFCLAWTCWFIEHRIKNKNVELKILIEKTLRKMIKLNLSFSEYIRNYANNMNKIRIRYLKKIGIPKEKISNEVLENNFEDMIIEYIKKNL